MQPSFLVAYGVDVPNHCQRVVGARALRATLDTFRRVGLTVAVFELCNEEQSMSTDRTPYKITYTGYALNGSTLPSTPVMTRKATSKMRVRGTQNAENTVRMLREAGYRNVTMKAVWF